MKARVTRERVIERLSYDPETGYFHWIVRRRGRIRADRRAGWIDDGYIRITIDGKKYQATHLAWLIVHGKWPESMIDHKNGVTLDNRIENLREATNAQNQQNKRACRSSTTGLKGVTVYWKRGCVSYRAVICQNNRQTIIGRFKAPSAAHEAYCREAMRLFGEFARVA